MHLHLIELRSSTCIGFLMLLPGSCWASKLNGVMERDHKSQAKAYEYLNLLSSDIHKEGYYNQIIIFTLSNISSLQQSMTELFQLLTLYIPKLKPTRKIP